MCVNKIKQAARDAVKFIFDKTSIDYQICKRCIEYALKLFYRLDFSEKTTFINYLDDVAAVCRKIRHNSRKGGNNE